MKFSIISPSNIEKERESIISIFNCIDQFKSIIFNSGAGAGKTFALIESLKYVIGKNNVKLKLHNQRIICITYTNVATSEVKERLGNTDLVLISTIHERIWALIKKYQKQLVDIHKEKLIAEISVLENKLINGDECEKYRELEEQQQDRFKEIIFDNKDLFYKKTNNNSKAAEVKEAFNNILVEFPNMLKNIEKFKKTVTTLYKIEKFYNCVNNIDLRKNGYTSVEYNAVYNSDQLDKMRISHDTLLDYGLKIIEKYDVLKHVIIDKYPYIFIDEYQDTNEKVVLIMKILENYAVKINRKIFIGYFGDTAQNIYEEGIGSRISEKHPGLVSIYKEFNRRSTKEVIEVINNVRNDQIKQISIFEDSEGGSVKFYKGASSDVINFISKYVDKWNVTLSNQLHCLVLTNKTVAEYSGFIKIYEVFKETGKYKGINYNQLNTELLSNDLSRLGEVPKLIFNIINLYYSIINKKTPILDILPRESLYEDMDFCSLKKLLKSLSSNSGETLEELISSISNTYNKGDDVYYKKLIDWTIGFKNVSTDCFADYLLEKLFYNVSSEEFDAAKDTIKKIMEISLDEYLLWFKFITEKQNENVIYHTYHGTKGREFENVLIIMENAFGITKNFFNFFFENVDSFEGLSIKEKEKFEKIKNLLYVSCSRAIKNLRILYINDVANFENGIKQIFGQIYTSGEAKEQ